MNSDNMFFDEKKFSGLDESIFRDVPVLDQVQFNTININNKIKNNIVGDHNISNFEELTTIIKEINNPNNFLANININNNLQSLYKQISNIDEVFDKVFLIYRNKNIELARNNIYLK